MEASRPSYTDLAGIDANSSAVLAAPLRTAAEKTTEDTRGKRHKLRMTRGAGGNTQLARQRAVLQE